MRSLSLYSGGGGGLLGEKLLKWEHKGYVEKDEHCQQSLRQRIIDECLDKAPIFTDVHKFIQSGAARQYRGFIDVVSAGFVCTEISNANPNPKGMSEGVSFETWKATAHCVRLIRPPIVWLENSPEILNRGFERVANDLAAMGYSFRWGVLGASALGGVHHRARWWLVAYADSAQLKRGGVSFRVQQKDPYFGYPRERQDKPGVDRTSYDGANRLDRLKAIGNMQVPRVVATAWRLLNEAHTSTE